MNDIAYRLGASLVLSSNQNIVLVRETERPNLYKLWDEVTDHPICGHRYSKHLLVNWWLKNTKTEQDQICPYCQNGDPSTPCSNILTPVTDDLYDTANVYTSFSSLVEGTAYDSTILLNQEDVFKALHRSNAVTPLIPEFYDEDEEGNKNCPLGRGKLALMTPSTMVGKGGFGTVFRLSIKDETLKKVFDVPVVVKSIRIDASHIRRAVHTFHGRDYTTVYLTKPYLNDVLLSSLMSNLVTKKSKKACPHFPLVYGFFACDDDQDSTDRRGYIIMEALDGNLQASNNIKRGGLLGLADRGMTLSADVLRTMAFQIVFAIALIADEYGVVHNDPVARNILVKLLYPTQESEYMWKGTNLSDPQLVFSYTVGMHRFFLPNLGVLAKLSDFGISASYGDPIILLKQTVKKDRDDFGEFSVESKDFRQGFDLAYFIASFTQETCFEAVFLLKDWSKTASRKGDHLEAARFDQEAKDIIQLSNDLLFELLRQRGSLKKRKREETDVDKVAFERDLQKRFKGISTIEEGWAIAMEGDRTFKHLGALDPVPGKILYDRVDPITFMLRASAFLRYKTQPAPIQLSNQVSMGYHSGNPPPSQLFVVLD